MISHNSINENEAIRLLENELRSVENTLELQNPLVNKIESERMESTNLMIQNGFSNCTDLKNNIRNNYICQLQNFNYRNFNGHPTINFAFQHINMHKNHLDFNQNTLINNNSSFKNDKSRISAKQCRIRKKQKFMKLEEAIQNKRQNNIELYNRILLVKDQLKEKLKCAEK